MDSVFAPQNSSRQVEQGDELAPKFDADGLIPCVTCHADTGEVLMFAWMNGQALTRTIETGEVHYWSRSRNQLWKKGETSGLTQTVRQMLIDCDQDCLVLRVELGRASADDRVEASCHVGYRNCFYREVPVGSLPNRGPVRLRFVAQKVFDPTTVYGESSK